MPRVNSACCDIRQSYKLISTETTDVGRHVREHRDIPCYACARVNSRLICVYAPTLSSHRFSPPKYRMASGTDTPQYKAVRNHYATLADSLSDPNAITRLRLHTCQLSRIFREYPGKQGYIPESRENAALSRILAYRSTSQRGRTFVRARARSTENACDKHAISSLARTHAFFFFLEEGVAPQG